MSCARRLGDGAPRLLRAAAEGDAGARGAQPGQASWATVLQHAEEHVVGQTAQETAALLRAYLGGRCSAAGHPRLQIFHFLSDKEFFF